MDENEIAKVIVDAAMKVHKALGPGLLESVYERVLCRQLRKRGLEVKCQVPIPITYEDMVFDPSGTSVNNQITFRLNRVIGDIRNLVFAGKRAWVYPIGPEDRRGIEDMFGERSFI